MGEKSGCENANIPGHFVVTLAAVLLPGEFLMFAEKPAFLGQTASDNTLLFLAVMIFPAVQAANTIRSSARLLTAIVFAAFLSRPGFGLRFIFGHGRYSLSGCGGTRIDLTVEWCLSDWSAD
jgi:hypothetical protein